MDNWDRLGEYAKKAGTSYNTLKTKYAVKAQAISLAIDKYKLVRKMYVLGIAVNCLLLYRNY